MASHSTILDHAFRRTMLLGMTVLVGTLACGCELLESPVLLQMPTEAAVSHIGRSSDGLPITATVRASHVGDPIILRLKVTNVFETLVPDSFDVNSHTADRFAVWLVRDGHEVAQTTNDAMYLLRKTAINNVFASALPKKELEPGDVDFQEIELARSFQISEPGVYTVIALRGPFFSNNDPHRNSIAVKTSFNLLR